MCLCEMLRCFVVGWLLLRFFFHSLNLHCFLLFVAWHTGLVYRHDDRVGAYFNSTLHTYNVSFIMEFVMNMPHKH